MDIYAINKYIIAVTEFLYLEHRCIYYMCFGFYYLAQLNTGFL